MDSTAMTSYPYETTATATTRSQKLTAGFYRPQLLRKCQTFNAAPGSYEHVLVGSVWRKANVVDGETNKSAVVVLVGVTLATTTVIGVALGSVTKRAELDMAAGAGLFALTSVLDGLLFWLVD
jgi:hypothetical protein